MGVDSKCTILVTGFGPFDVHAVNASWEAVKELEKLWANAVEFSDVKLITEEIPVSYNYVSTHIPQLWKKHNPMIVLHVGVSHKAECLTIECRAYNNGYQRFDIHTKCPDEMGMECKVLETGIDTNELCDNVNKNCVKSGCKACVSCDAGRYLCEYTFYQSLSIDSTKVLFVHVPDLNKYTSTQTAKGLYDILCHLINNSKYR
ncbi:PREDICTED: pyroglutamyl-peptidase 1 isoform X1 [Dinoponera quadriceps]|uniref:Pyroglutamyl-peptidase 1 isoform X1 n=1 Tax=Dinoponera quadriceps TaxID=609295 RepID=A0A6P3XK81_DINQU|nr:PREDICTED: pyroglutamyl-peptidase 1 isoform X1 [Dinoponera quadriceps]